MTGRAVGSLPDLPVEETPERPAHAITVVTPTIPPRRHLLVEAMASVVAQTLAPEAHIVVTDTQGAGEATTRNRGIRAVDTEWMAFLDDDDVLYPTHLEWLAEVQAETNADLVFGRFDGGIEVSRPKPGRLDPMATEALRIANFVPVTYLVRTDLAQSVDGMPQPFSPTWPRIEVDWGFLVRLLNAGAVFAHTDAITWFWRRHDGQLGSRTWTEVA